ncbi:ferritin [Anaerolineales bacterium HSG24]|nr:ferritin [Anaerolineales bacterium HSG24]
MTSLLKQSIVDAINKQVIEEFTASMQYLAIAFHFESETLPELANFFHLQAQEEHEHAMKLLSYISEAGGHPVLPATKQVKNEFKTAEECVDLALQQELQVTNQINALVDLAVNERDHLTRQFLQWFVTEQLEEVSSMGDLLNVVRRAGEHNLLLVEDYLIRNPHELAKAGEA